MGTFLHSLPWTLALALAQAGDSGEVRLPAGYEALFPTELENGPGGLTPPSGAPELREEVPEPPSGG